MNARLWIALGEWPGILLLAIVLMALLLGTVRAGLVVARRKRNLADAQLRTLFDLIPAMIWFKDTTNHHVRVNKRVADAVGLRVSDIEGRHCAETYPEHAARYYTEDL
ncbi:MAG: PAS domain S-box protein, partial [Acidobacteriota bacterium]